MRQASTQVAVAPKAVGEVVAVVQEAVGRIAAAAALGAGEFAVIGGGAGQLEQRSW